MANHKSAVKRSRQSLKRNLVNKSLLTSIKKNIVNFSAAIKSKNTDKIHESMSKINSSMSKAVKKGIIKKEFMSRKLSSLSKQIKKI